MKSVMRFKQDNARERTLEMKGTETRNGVSCEERSTPVVWKMIICHYENAGSYYGLSVLRSRHVQGCSSVPSAVSSFGGSKRDQTRSRLLTKGGDGWGRPAQITHECLTASDIVGSEDTAVTL